MKWFLKALKQYADFRGRARRCEWWWFYFFAILPTLIVVLLGAVLVPNLLEDGSVAADGNQGSEIFVSVLALLGLLYGLALFIPAVAVTVRRFHDVGLSGWLMLTPALPFVFLFSGAFEWAFYSMVAVQLGFLVVLLMDSQPRANCYGPDPKGERAPTSTHKTSVPQRNHETAPRRSGHDWTLEGINPEPDAPPSIRLNLSAEVLRRRCVVGRKADAVDFVLPNTSVSGCHAELWEESGSLMLEDLGSSNGTRVNGTEISPHESTEIMEGDQIEFGEVRLTLRRK